MSSWRQGIPVPIADGIIAAALVTAALVSVANTSGAAHPWSELAAAGAVGPTALRSRAPAIMAVCSSIFVSLYAVLPGASAPLWAFLAVLVICFSAGLGLIGRNRLVAIGLLLISSYVLQFHAVDADHSNADLWVTPLILVGLPALAGSLLQRSRRQAATLERLTIELQDERRRHAEEAVLAERRRIARELHDVISHSVSVMVVQAGAAEQLLTADAAALDQIRAVRTTGKEALGELRRQLGMLRDHEDDPFAPLPGLADIPALTEASGATLTVTGHQRESISAGLALTAYRTVQEALTNSRRHAAGSRVDVHVRHRPGVIEIQVDDMGGELGRPNGNGNGLRGMAERVELYGGRLEVGARPDDLGWRVIAQFPLASISEPS